MSESTLFEPFELSVLGADGHIWLSAHSAQGSVYGVPCRRPDFDLAEQGPEPADWLEVVVREARKDRDEEAHRVGARLRDLAFGVPEIATLFHHTRGVAAARGAQVLLRVLAAPRELSSWPWELMLDPRHSARDAQGPTAARYLTMSRDVHVVRAGRERTYPVRHAPIAPPLNVLLVLSSPLRDGLGDDETPFDLYQEKRALLAELEPLVARGLLHVDVEDRPTIAQLRARMGSQQRGYHIVHYLGHAQPHGLKLESSNGRGRLVASVDFSRLLQELPNLRLAVFAGCETARAPATSPTSDEPGAWPGQLSTADHCVRDACPMVVGMQAVLPFGTERLFTRSFYQALTGGRSVADAARLARLAIAEDDHAGDGRLNWAVPCLVVGDSEPGPLVDPTTRGAVPARTRRVGARLGVDQSELRFISRTVELRLGVDVMSARDDRRVLMVMGSPGTGKSAFLDRVVEELDPAIAYLHVNAERLLAETDPLDFLCHRVADLFARAGRRPPRQNRQPAADWWDLLLEELVSTRFALAIDDAHLLDGDGQAVEDLRTALLSYAGRRGWGRLALATRDDLTFVGTAVDPVRMAPVLLKPLLWAEIWQWIRRNLPVLSRFEEYQLSPFSADLSKLEAWEQLAGQIEKNPSLTTAGLPDVVRTVASSLMTLPSTRPAPPPVFGAEPAAPRTRATAHRLRTLRVAVAGPYTAGRGEEFARGITQYAAQHHVAGRVNTTLDATSRLAELLVLESPFDADGQSDLPRITRWLNAARAAEADVILLDFGSAERSDTWDDLLGVLARDNRLVVAAGGNDGRPSYPAWCVGALAVGALGGDGLPTDYSVFHSDPGKPEVYAPETVAGSPLAVIVPDPTRTGTSFAALHAVAAVTVVWASDRGQSAQDVRTKLIETATPVPGQDRVRRLDVDRAIASTRRQVLLDALEAGPLELHELLATTGMRSELALPLLDAEAATGNLRRFTEGGAEHYEYRQATYLTFGSVRQLEPGKTRDAAIDALVDHVRGLANRDRYTVEAVRAMWESGEEGRRVAALAVAQAAPALGTAAMVTDGIGSSSGFEQYHGLLAGQVLLPRLSPEERTGVRVAIDRQLTSGCWEPDSRRRRLAERLLGELDDPASPGT